MKKGYIALVILLIAAFAGYAIFKPKVVLPASLENVLKSESQVTVTAATITDDYIEIKSTTTPDKISTTTVRKIVWEGLGFEPGFAFKVFSETEMGKEIVTANIITQEGEVYSGILNFANGTYAASLQDVNSKKKNSISITFSEKACVKPDGSNAKYATNIKIGTHSMTGCADKFN